MKQPVFSLKRWWLVIFILSASLFHTIVAEGYVAMSLEQLQSNLKACKINPESSIPLTAIIGVSIGNSGDIILLGLGPGQDKSWSEIKMIRIENVVLAMRAIFTGYQPPGVITIGPLSLNTSITSLVYSGGIENTRVGAYMANCIKQLHLLGINRSHIRPEGFWPYGDLPKERFWLCPKKGKYYVSTDNKVMFLSENGVVLCLKNKTLDDVDPRIKDWADQVSERYDELATLCPEFFQLKNFFNLCRVFEWAKGRIDKEKWSYLLEEYRPVSRLTPNFFDFALDDTIAGGISCKVDKIIQRESRLDNLEKEIFESAGASKNSLYRCFQSSLLDEVFDTKRTFRRVVSRLKAVGLYSRSVFLILENRPTKLTILHNDLFYREDNMSAKTLKWLIEETVQGKEDTNKGWEEFYQKHLSSLVGEDSDITIGKMQFRLKPLLIFVADWATPEWIRLQRVKALNQNFLLFIIPAGNSEKPLTSIMAFLDKVEKVPVITRKNFGLAIHIPNEEIGKWVEEIGALKREAGEDRVLINPQKADLERLLRKRDIKIIFLDLNSTKEEIKFGNEELSYRDILKFKSLFHIRYLVAGLFNPQKIGWGEIVLKAMQAKEVGIVSVSPGVISTQEALRRLGVLIQILKDDRSIFQKAFYIPDVVEQRGTATASKIISWEKIP